MWNVLAVIKKDIIPVHVLSRYLLFGVVLMLKRQKRVEKPKTKSAGSGSVQSEANSGLPKEVNISPAVSKSISLSLKSNRVTDEREQIP